MWCEDNFLVPLKPRSFSDAMVSIAGKYQLEHCNTVLSPDGRRVWGYLGLQAMVMPDPKYVTT